MYLDTRLRFRRHIFYKRKQLSLKFNQMYWVIDRKSQLPLDNKFCCIKKFLNMHEAMAFIWNTASSNNIEILHPFKNKIIHAIVNAPYYVPNRFIYQDIPVAPIKEVITEVCKKYHERLLEHLNILANQVCDQLTEARRLKRRIHSDPLNSYIYTTD